MFKRKGILSLLFLSILIFVYLLLKESPMTLRQEIDHAPKVVQTASQHMLDLDMYSSNAILVNLDENQIVLDKKVRKRFILLL